MSRLAGDPSAVEGERGREVPAAEPAPTANSTAAWPRRVPHVVAAHPVVAVAVLAVFVGVANLAWTVANRQPGGLDVDEVSYLTQAFRWHRVVDPAHPFAVYSGVLDQDKGPVTMLVSVVALLVGPNTVGTAFAASAFLHGMSAVAVAGIANRLAGARTAIVAGLVALALPAAVVAARSYQLAPAVGAALTLAVWSLLASERGRRPWPMLAFGVSVGLLLLSRTMAVSFLPGLVVGGLMYLDRTRVVVRNAAMSIAVALVIALPWWVYQRGSIADYLFGHGYGDAAEGYGPAGVADRALARWQIVADAAGPFLVGIGVVVIFAAVVRGVRRADRASFVGSFRSEVAVVWITVAFGVAALMSTANLGMYFELPLIVLAVPGTAALAVRLPAPAPRWVGCMAATLAAVTLIVSFTDSGGLRDGLQRTLFPGLANYQRSTIAAEPRLGSSDRQVRLDAMEEWWEASRQVMDQVAAEVTAEPVMLTTCGSGPQISAGTFTLAGELDQRLRDSWSQWLSTSAPPSEMEAAFQPRAGEKPRIVVLIDSASPPFPGEESAERCTETAVRLGWRTTSEVDLPDGGTAAVMVHSDRG